MDEIDKKIFSKYPINNFAEIWSELSRLSFTKKTEIPENIVCFLEKGMIRKIYIDTTEESAEEISTDFFFSGDIFPIKNNIDEQNRFDYKPINNGILWYVDIKIVQKLFVESKLCGTIQKVFLENQLKEKTSREIQLLKSSPKQMYLYLMKYKPHYIQNVPLRYLSSYLGITPQSLSRIRKQII